LGFFQETWRKAFDELAVWKMFLMFLWCAMGAYGRRWYQFIVDDDGGRGMNELYHPWHFHTTMTSSA